MKEAYVKGLAIRDGPESCGGARKGKAEALTGESAGRVLSREIMLDRDADPVRRRGRPQPADRKGKARSGWTPCSTRISSGLAQCTSRSRSRQDDIDDGAGRKLEGPLCVQHSGTFSGLKLDLGGAGTLEVKQVHRIRREHMDGRTGSPLLVQSLLT
jgi:hypothetical protein